MQTYKWLLMVVGDNGRYEKTIELPFVPQIGMTIFRGGAQLMWEGESDDAHNVSPSISKFGYNLDEEQFEVEMQVDGDVHLTSTFWGSFIPS